MSPDELLMSDLDGRRKHRGLSRDLHRWVLMSPDELLMSPDELLMSHDEP